jgi:hypothetical protein
MTQMGADKLDVMAGLDPAIHALTEGTVPD